jgi:hypothetical protein
MGALFYWLNSLSPQGHQQQMREHSESSQLSWEVSVAVLCMLKAELMDGSIYRVQDSGVSAKGLLNIWR